MPAHRPGWSSRCLLFLRQQVHEHVRDWKPVHRRTLGLEYEQHPPAVGDRLLVEIRSDSPRAVLDVPPILESRPLSRSGYPRRRRLLRHHFLLLNPRWSAPLAFKVRKVASGSLGAYANIDSPLSLP